MAIAFKRDLDGVDWAAMKAVLAADDFDNGRTPAQLAASFRNSFGTCIAYHGDQIVGTARVLSDGVCNAYVVDVWTLTAYRKQGIACAMIGALLQDLHGQHVYLFTDGAEAFYRRIGFVERGIGFERVVGEWLVNDPA